MNKDWFEKNLGEKYPAEAHDFNVDAAWAALGARRRKKRRRRFVFWWMAAAALILPGIATFIWQMNGTSQIRQTEQPVAAPLGEPASIAALPPESAFRQFSDVTPDIEFQDAKTAARAITKSAIVHTTRILPASDYRRPETDTRFANITLPLLQVEPGAVASISAAIKSLSPVVFDQTAPRRPFKMPRWWLGASAFYGLNLVERTGQADYTEKRATEESALDMFQAGFDIRRQLNRHFFVQTGLYFAQWTDGRKSQSAETYTVSDSSYVIARIVKADGTIEDIHGVANIVHVRTITRETYNRYRHLELPVLAGMSMPVAGQWHAEVAAGPVIGLLSTRSGAIADFDTDGDLQLKNALLRNSVTLSGMIRLEWLYNTLNWSAGLGLMGRTTLNSWTKPGAAFSERRTALGAGLVFRKTLR